jgi:hypothetical protein
MIGDDVRGNVIETEVGMMGVPEDVVILHFSKQIEIFGSAFDIVMPPRGVPVYNLHFVDNVRAYTSGARPVFIRRPIMGGTHKDAVGKIIVEIPPNLKGRSFTAVFELQRKLDGFPDSKEMP